MRATYAVVLEPAATARLGAESSEQERTVSEVHVRPSRVPRNETETPRGGRTPAASLSSPPDPYSVSRILTPPPLSYAHIHLAWGNAGEVRTEGIPEGRKEDLLEDRQRGLLTST